MSISSLFTAKEAVVYGWKTFKTNWKFLVTAYIIIFVLSMIPNFSYDWARENQPSISFIFQIIGWLVKMITSIGIIVISLKFVDKKKPELADIYQHYKLLINYFFGSVLYGLVIAAGLILLIVPGIIWGIKYQFTTYLIIDKKMSPIEAFKESGKMTKGFNLKLFYLGLAFIGLTVIGLITLGVGFIIIWPIISLAGAYVYRKLSLKKK